jgi:hypothetical protein
MRLFTIAPALGFVVHPWVVRHFQHTALPSGSGEDQGRYRDNKWRIWPWRFLVKKGDGWMTTCGKRRTATLTGVKATASPP